MNRLKDYKIVGDPIAPRPITVLEVLNHLKLDPDLANNTTVELQINSMIDAAILAAEKITKKTFRLSNLVAYWDYLCGGRYAYEVRSSPFGSLSGLVYQSGGDEIVYDHSQLKIIFDTDFSRLQPGISSEWPSNTDDVLQAATLSYTAGYAEGTLPADLKQALLIHIGAMWANRGDCTSGATAGLNSCSMGCALPLPVQNVYRINRILDIVVGA